MNFSEEEYVAKYGHPSLEIPYETIDRWCENDYELVLIEEGTDNPDSSMFRLFVARPKQAMQEVTGDGQAYARRIKELVGEAAP